MKGHIQIMSEQEQKKVAMVIMAHPDDAEFSCSGTVALWVREGWDVYYVICTDGGSGGPDHATDVGPVARRQVVETRVKEQLESGKVLGLKAVLFLGYPDGQLQASLEVRRDIVRLLRRYRPTRVICQSPDRSWTPSMSMSRSHPDHLAAGRVVLDAIYPASQNPWDFPELLEEGLAPHKVSEVYIVGAPVQNHFVDITTTIDVKLEALRAHASQVGSQFAEIEPWLRTRMGEVGKLHDVAYAEDFHRVENR